MPSPCPEADKLLDEVIGITLEMADEMDIEDIRRMLVSNQMMHMALTIIAEQPVKLTVETCRQFARNALKLDDELYEEEDE